MLSKILFNVEQNTAQNVHIVDEYVKTDLAHVSEKWITDFRSTAFLGLF